MDPIALAKQIIQNVQGNCHEKASVDLRTLLAYDAPLGDKWGDLARIALIIGEKAMAMDCANRFFNTKPGRERIVPVAGIYAEAGALDKAIEFVEKRMGNVRDFASFHFLGTVYGQLGQLDKAIENLTGALKIHAPSGITWLTLSAYADFAKHPELLTQLSEQCQKAQDKDWQNAGRLYFALAKAQADVKDKDASMSAYQKANQIFSQHTKHQSVRPAVDKSIEVFNRDMLMRMPTPRLFTDRPIFIAGLPRSGTTLLEQIISSHSAVVGGGEQSALRLALNGVGETDIYKVLQSGDNEKIVDYFDLAVNRYLHLSEEQFGYEGRFVDKSLSNNRYLGIIASMFPKAPIIIIRRQPQDIAWSAYRACFNDNSTWSWSPERIAEYIHAEEKLFDHWLKVIPGRILEVRYEDLVGNFDNELMRIMNFLSLPIESGQKTFYKSDSVVTTSSVAQVRAPLDKGGINRSQDGNAFVEQFQTFYQRQ